MKIALMVVLAYLADNGLLVHRADSSLPRRELRRLPRRLSAGLLALREIGTPAYLFICLVSTASAATLFWLSAEISYWLGAAVALAIGIEVYRSYRYLKPAGLLWRAVNWFALVVAKLLQPMAPWLAKLPHKKPQPPHSRLFETDDLIDLLNRQVHQADNRISQADLDTALAALGFSTKTVSSIMVPIKDVRIVLPDEAIGPHLMDELHASGYSSFPVGKKIGKKLPPQISGVVYLKDLIANPLKTTVSQVAFGEVSYIDKDQKLISALEEFLKGHSLMLIVTNEREEPVGALWLEDVLEQLLGRKVMPETDNPADADIRQVEQTDQKVVK